MVSPGAALACWPVSEFGVLCKRADGEQIVVHVEAEHAQDALEQVDAHRRLFYGGGDAAGRWLASQNPGTIIEVSEVRPLPWPPWDE